jgi:potassium-transporting ATPase KdpC subunit
MKTIFRPAISLLLGMMFITGVVYPAAVTVLAQLLFHDTANGSIVTRNGHALGSHLIGQPFGDPKYFWGRPSATAPFANNPSASGASNLGPNNSALTDAVKQRIEALRTADPDNKTLIPVDLVTASASGVDPDISPAAAQYQLARVARVRGASPTDIAKLVDQATEGRQLGFMGEARVNVLKLNLLLDGRG